MYSFVPHYLLEYSIGWLEMEFSLCRPLGTRPLRALILVLKHWETSSTPLCTLMSFLWCKASHSVYSACTHTHTHCTNCLLDYKAYFLGHVCNHLLINLIMIAGHRQNMNYRCGILWVYYLFIYFCTMTKSEALSREPSWSGSKVFRWGNRSPWGKALVSDSHHENSGN